MLAAFSVDMWSLGMLAYEIFEGYTPAIPSPTSSLTMILPVAHVHQPLVSSPLTDCLKILQDQSHCMAILSNAI